MRLYDNAPISAYEEIKTWYPVWYQDILEMNVLWRIWGTQLDKIQASIISAVNNNFIDTADAEIVARLEDFLWLPPDASKPLSERRRIIKALILSTNHIGQREIKEYVAIFTNGEISIELYGGTIRVTVTRDCSDPFNLYNCTFVLNKKIPAHLTLEMADRLTPVSARNSERFLVHRLRLPGLRFFGNGARNFKSVAVCCTGISFTQPYGFTGSVTTDSRWYLDGTYTLDGTRHLDAGVTVQKI